jgi:hypothetical protein
VFLFKGKTNDFNNKSEKTMSVTDFLKDNEQIGDDITNFESNLPLLDISKSMELVFSYKKQMEQGLNEFSDKLNKLKEISLDISDEFSLQEDLLNRINDKSGRETESLLKSNKKVKELQTEISNSTRYCIIFIILMIVLFIIAAVLIYIAAVLR